MSADSTWKTKTDFMFLSLALGAIVGSIVWLFLFLMGWGLALVWTMLPQAVGWRYLPVAICVVGGVVMGLYEKACGPYPESMNDVMAEVKREGRYRYGEGRLARGFLGALLPLVFGGSIGPEAGLTGTIAGLCTWVGDRLKTAGAEAREFTTMGISATLTALFNAPLYGFVAPFEDDRCDFSFTKKQKAVCYLLAIIGGMTVMTCLNSVLGGGMSLPRFDAFTLATGDLLWLIPFALAGVAMGYLYYAADLVSRKVSALFGDKAILRAAVCGLVLGGVGMLVPYALFAGESQAESIIEGWSAMAAGLLIATGLVKTCMTPYCIRNGWRGGNIFPLIFSGICVGYGLAALTGATAGFAVCVVVASLCGAVMRRPLGVVALMLLCFPLQGIVFLAIGAVVGAKVPLPPVLRPHKEGAMELADGEGA